MKYLGYVGDVWQCKPGTYLIHEALDIPYQPLVEKVMWGQRVGTASTFVALYCYKDFLNGIDLFYERFNVFNVQGNELTILDGFKVNHEPEEFLKSYSEQFMLLWRIETSRPRKVIFPENLPDSIQNSLLFL